MRQRETLSPKLNYKWQLTNIPGISLTYLCMILKNIHENYVFYRKLFILIVKYMLYVHNLSLLINIKIYNLLESDAWHSRNFEKSLRSCFFWYQYVTG